MCVWARKGKYLVLFFSFPPLSAFLGEGGGCADLGAGRFARGFLLSSEGCVG